MIRIWKGRRGMEKWKKYPATALFVLANAVMFVIVEIGGSSESSTHLLKYGAMYVPLVTQEGQWFRVLTAMFLHFGMEHLLNNMLVLIVLGLRLEPLFGSISYALVYLLGGIGGNLASMRFSPDAANAVSAGASGAVFALMGAMLYALLQGKGRVKDLSSTQILVMAAMSLYLGFASKGVDNIAHIGGMVCGFCLAVILYHPKRRHV